jgi:excisionase family DNA binding protein
MPDDCVAVMTPEEIAAVVSGAVERAIASRPLDAALLDARAAAFYLGVSLRTVESWVARRLLPTCELPPSNGGRRGIRRFRRADLERWIAAHRLGDSPSRT